MSDVRIRYLSWLLVVLVTGCGEKDDKAPCEIDLTVCEDGVECTSDICLPNDTDANSDGCLITQDDFVCDDGASCTTDACRPSDPAADEGSGCVNIADDATCDDGVDCTEDLCLPGDELADPESGCVNQGC